MSDPKKRTPRPFLGVQFRCCRIYGRIYRNARGDAFAGHCPGCLSPCRVRITHQDGPNVVKSRFGWVAG